MLIWKAIKPEITSPNEVDVGMESQRDQMSVAEVLFVLRRMGCKVSDRFTAGSESGGAYGNSAQCLRLKSTMFSFMISHLRERLYDNQL